MLVVTGLQVPTITVVYTNHRGETAVRRIRPFNLYFGSTVWHPRPQWLMDAFDEEKNATRTFALEDMKPYVNYADRSE